MMASLKVIFFPKINYWELPLGKPSLEKKFYFTKKFRKTLTPPRRGFMKLFFLVRTCPSPFKSLKKRYENEMTPTPPFAKFFRKIDFFSNDGFPKLKRLSYYLNMFCIPRY